MRVPSENIDVPLPFACAHVLLDGADIPFFALIQECPLEDVRMGMRVEAVWAPQRGARADLRRASATSGRPASPTRRTTSYKEHL